jgi:hypothetical protein
VTGTSKATRVLWWSALATLVLIVAWALLPGAIVMVTGSHGPGWLQGSSLPVLTLGGMPVGCVLWVAELMRRGEIRGRAAPRVKGLPRGTNVSRVDMLSVPVHLAWFAGMSVAGGAAFALSWPYTGDDAFVTWQALGAILVPCAGASLGSFVKKVAWSRHVRSGRRTAPPSAFWRWVTYRWRLDLWICALGFAALCVGAAIARLMVVSTNFGTAEEYAEARIIVSWLLSGGAVALVAGLWMATQFWRSGEDLATGESVV